MGSTLSIIYRVNFNQNDDITFNLLNVNLVLVGSKPTTYTANRIDNEKQVPPFAPPARAKMRGPNLYPDLDVTSPSDLERGGLSGNLNSGGSNRAIQTNHSGVAHSIPSNELHYWA
ncbi:hypothetical protein NHQ30_009870 [Ciborinia camelliae]|nr:hypothetical protein NHQ30_009870 [Ciborinia camelliae]